MERNKNRVILSETILERLIIQVRIIIKYFDFDISFDDIKSKCPKSSITDKYLNKHLIEKEVIM